MYKLNEHVAVAAQISVSDVAKVAEAGYKVLVNNRPDDEDPAQPSAAEIAAAATEAGLEYHHLPVSGMNFPGPGFDQMADLFDDADRPVFAFCRSGTRSANLWVVSREPAERPEAEAVARGYGLDLGFAAHFFSRS